MSLFQWQLGNPVLEFATDFNSRAEFLWSHGLISDSTYTIFSSACNYSRYVSEYYRGSLSSVCSRVMSQVTRETSRFVDKYDVTLDVCISSVLSQSKALSPQVGQRPCHSSVLSCSDEGLMLSLHTDEVLLPTKQQVTERIDVCVEDETVNYLNRKDVQSALHARLAGVTRWSVCSR